jgi:hypothetical protein
MPITYQIRTDEKLLIFSHSGVVKDDEFLSFYKTLYEDNRFDKSFNTLVDLRRAESVVRSAAALNAFAEYVQQQYANITARPKVAVVAPKDVSFGLARMYAAFSETVPWEFIVFRDAGAALAWLGLPESMIDDLDQNSQPKDSSDA